MLKRLVLPQTERLYQLHSIAALHFRRELRGKGSNSREAREFVENRGFVVEDVIPYGLGLATYDESLDEIYPVQEGEEFSRYRSLMGRLVFSLYDAEGRVIGFSGRDMTGTKSAKYWNSPTSPIFNKGSKFYGLNWALPSIRQLGFAILVEGQFDVIRCHLAGFTNTLATLGTAFKAEHARILKRYTNTVVVAYDNDPVNENGVNPGQKAARKAVKILKSDDIGIDARHVILPKEMDPDTLIRTRGKKKFKLLIDEAIAA